MTGPRLRDTSSWDVKAAEVAVVVVPDVGAVWVMVPPETVRVKLQVPVSP